MNKRINIGAIIHMRSTNPDNESYGFALTSVLDFQRAKDDVRTSVKKFMADRNRELDGEVTDDVVARILVEFLMVYDYYMTYGKISKEEWADESGLVLRDLASITGQQYLSVDLLVDDCLLANQMTISQRSKESFEAELAMYEFKLSFTEQEGEL